MEARRTTPVTASALRYRGGVTLLSTDRLDLRLYEATDASSLERIYARPDVSRFLLDEPWNADDAERHVRERQMKTDLDGSTGALALVIEHQRTVVGDVQLWFTDRERRVAEIGWVLDPAHGGRGLASEAVSAVLRFAFDTAQVHRVTAQMDARNTASAQLAARVGMRSEAHFRQDWWSKGEWTDTLVFGMLATDFTTE